jgi:hypothetical protein
MPIPFLSYLASCHKKWNTVKEKPPVLLNVRLLN